MTEEEFLKKIAHRAAEFTLKPGTFDGCHKKCVFIDHELGEFITNPNKIIQRGASHPARRMQKISATCMEKYGVPHAATATAVIAKKKATSLERYGHECSLRNPLIEEKTKQTCLKNWGTEFIFASQEIQKRIVETNLKKYGVPYHTQSHEYQELRAKLCLPDGSSITAAARTNNIPYGTLFGYLKRHGPDEVAAYIPNYKPGISSLEAFCEKLFSTKKFNKKNKAGYRPDFRLAEDFFVDVDGLYWHNANNVPNDYHFKKRFANEKESFTLMQFRADEIEKKPEICKSIVANRLGKSTRVYARKLKIVELTPEETLTFLAKNHLMSALKRKSFALQTEGVTYAAIVVSFSDGVLKVERFCSLINCSVVGGYSKLLSHVEKTYCPREVHTWVDLRYGDGHSLEKIGFIKQRDVLSWRWTDSFSTFNRLRCRANMDARRLSEKEHAAEKKWTRIYDAGQRLFVKLLPGNPCVKGDLIR